MNRYDRTWKRGQSWLRVYAAEGTRGEQSRYLDLFTPRVYFHVKSGRTLYEEDYIGTEKPYQGEAREFWKVPSRWYYRGSDLHGVRRFGLGYLTGRFSTNRRFVAVHFYNGHVTISLRVDAGK